MLNNVHSPTLLQNHSPLPKRLFPTISTRPTSLSTAPPPRWAPGFHCRSPTAIFCSPLPGWALLEATTHPVPLHRVEKELLWRSPKSPAPPFRSSCLWGAVGCVCLYKTQWVPNRGHPLLCSEPSSDPAWRDGCFHGRCSTGAQTKAHPSRDTPMGPAATPAPTQKSSRQQCSPPPAFVKKEGFFRKREEKQRSPCSHPSEGASACTAHRPARLVPLWWLCSPVLSPRTPAPSPHTAAHTYGQHRGLSGGAGRKSQPPARLPGAFLWPGARPWCAAVSSGETSPLASPPVPACHGQGHAPTLAAMTHLSLSVLGAHGAGGPNAPCRNTPTLPGCGEGGRWAE